MGTRSRIGIQNDNGTIESVYCHWDGYPGHVGKVLKNFYPQESQVRKIMELGDLSSLYKNIDPNPDFPHSFDNPQDDVCVFYGRDRGESDTGSNTSENLKAFKELADRSCAEWVYLFKDGRWHYINENGNVAVLSDKVIRDNP